MSESNSMNSQSVRNSLQLAKESQRAAAHKETDKTVLPPLPKTSRKLYSVSSSKHVKAKLANDLQPTKPQGSIIDRFVMQSSFQSQVPV